MGFELKLSLEKFQINPFPHDFHDPSKGVAMSGITDVKNFITTDQLSIPKKLYTVRAEELTLCY